MKVWNSYINNEILDVHAQVAKANCEYLHYLCMNALFTVTTELKMEKNKKKIVREKKMEKTKLGISIEMLGAILYVSVALFGYFGLLVVGGYIVFIEKQEWLKKCVVKAVLLMLGFTLLSTVIGIIPKILYFGVETNTFFDGIYLYLNSTYQTVSFVLVVLNFIRMGIFLWLGIKAWKKQNGTIPIVDKFIEKYIKE